MLNIKINTIGYLGVALLTVDKSKVTEIMSILVDMETGTVIIQDTISHLVVVNILSLELLCQHYHLPPALLNRLSHPQLVVDQDGLIVMISVIILISVIVSVGQIVKWHVLHWMLPCCVSRILQRIVGYLVLVRHPYGLVTLIYQIRMVTISGYLDAARHTSVAPSVTSIIVHTEISMDIGTAIMTQPIVLLCVVVNIILTFL